MDAKKGGLLGMIALGAGAVLGFLLFRSLSPMTRATIGAFGLVGLGIAAMTFGMSWLAYENGISQFGGFAAAVGILIAPISAIMLVYGVRGVRQFHPPVLGGYK